MPLEERMMISANCARCGIKFNARHCVGYDPETGKLREHAPPLCDGCLEIRRIDTARDDARRLELESKAWIEFKSDYEARPGPELIARFKRRIEAIGGDSVDWMDLAKRFIEKAAKKRRQWK